MKKNEEINSRIAFDLRRALSGSRVFDLHKREVFNLRVIAVDKYCHELIGVSGGVEISYGEHELQMLD